MGLFCKCDPMSDEIKHEAHEGAIRGLFEVMRDQINTIELINERVKILEEYVKERSKS